MDLRSMGFQRGLAPYDRHNVLFFFFLNDPAPPEISPLPPPPPLPTPPRRGAAAPRPAPAPELRAVRLRGEPRGEPDHVRPRRDPVLRLRGRTGRGLLRRRLPQIGRAHV